MKIRSILVALVLAVPAVSFADHGHFSGGRGGWGGWGGWGGPRYGGSFSYGGGFYPYGYYAPAFGYGYYGAPVVYGPSRYYDRLAAPVEVAVQRALRRLGYYHGPIDGEIGSGSRAAIRRFQADNGLEVSGRIDRPLLRSLGV